MSFLNKRNNFKKGQAMLISVIFFSFISVSLILGIVSPVVREFNISKNLIFSKQSYYLAESGIEDALYRLQFNKQLSGSEILVLGAHSVNTSITSISGNQKKIDSLSDVYNRNRKLELIVNAGVGVSFNYGIQTGIGGLQMNNNSKVLGNVYSNGPILGSNGAEIIGSVYSANSSNLTSDQSNGVDAPLQFINFGNSNSTEDLSQSFKISDSNSPVNKFSFYIKKVGSPSNCTIRIMNNNSGLPGTTSYATGTLNSSSVGTNYSWVDVSLSTNPTLNINTIYWVVLDCSSNSSKYYTIGANSTYSDGQAKIGSFNTSWGNTSPLGLDIYFNVYLGGINGIINKVNVGSAGVGNAHAHIVANSVIAGNLYCKSGSGNNKACNTGLADPVQIDLPISEANISDWKSEASGGGIISGNQVKSGVNITLGPKKYEGNLTIDNNSQITINGTIWVVGNLTIDNNSQISLSPGYGSGSGVIVVDGLVVIKNGSNFSGSGASGSYIMLITTNSDSSKAIELNNNAGAVILYASNGTIDVAQNASAKEITAKKIILKNNANISYESGLANVNFVSGPGGSWNILKWKEVDS